MGGRDTFKDQGAEFLRSANASATYDYQEYMPAATQALAGSDILSDWTKPPSGSG